VQLHVSTVHAAPQLVSNAADTEGLRFPKFWRLRNPVKPPRRAVHPFKLVFNSFGCCTSTRSRARRRRTKYDDGGSIMTFFSFAIGFLAGLRSLTPPAIVAWAAAFGWLPIDGWLSFMGSTPAVAIFTLLAIGELVADKLPQTPARTAPIGLLGRLATGALTGACIASAGGHSALLGAGIAEIGAFAGTFGGYEARRRIVTSGIPDPAVAVLEDLITVFGCLWVVTRF
jgi:uncharacterized membrane protein